MIMYHDFTSLLAGFYRKQLEKWRNDELLRQRQQQQQNYNYASQFIQEALTIIFSQCSLSHRLSPIAHQYDILPYGFNVTQEDTVYYFLWSKKTSDVIGRPILDQIVDKMNCHIEFFRRQFYLSFSRLPSDDQILYVQLYPAIYNGFHIVDCIDKNTDIVLAVVFD